MAGSGGDLRLHQQPRASPDGESSSSSSPPQDPATLRDNVAVAEMPSKQTCNASNSSPDDVWAGLLECLIHQIITRLSSFHDILAFSSTCRDWRAAFFSFRPPFSSSIPPLLLQPRARFPHYNHAHDLLYNCEWELIDPAKKSSSCSRSPPLNLLKGQENLLKGMKYLGCSFGHLILSNLGQCLLVDVYGGTVVRPPRLSSTDKKKIYYGILVAPLNSPDSRLLFFSKSSLFQWDVGSNSWLQHRIDIEEIRCIMFFRGEMFATDVYGQLHTIRLVPQLRVHEVTTDWSDYYWRADEVPKRILVHWLVACGDMLLRVELLGDEYGVTDIFQVFRLNFSVKPAKWVKVESLGGYSLFISFNLRSQAFSCKNPERWGGKSNRIYVANPLDADEPWTIAELGQTVPHTTWDSSYLSNLAAQPVRYGARLDNLWVLPELVYGVGQ